MHRVERPRRFISRVPATIGPVSVAQRERPRVGANGWLALISLGALALGALVYVVDRPAVTVYLLPHAWSLARGHHPWFGSLGGHLPEFVHVYAFILLTLAVSPGRARALPICAFWWAVDSLFEIGQHPTLAPRIAASLPEWFQRIPILDHTANYFLHGTFDPGDLLAIALGTLVAYFSIRVLHHQGGGSWPQ